MTVHRAYTAFADAYLVLFLFIPVLLLLIVVVTVLFLIIVLRFAFFLRGRGFLELRVGCRALSLPFIDRSGRSVWRVGVLAFFPT